MRAHPRCARGPSAGSSRRALLPVVLTLAVIVAAVEWRPLVNAARLRTNYPRVEGHAEVIRFAAAESSIDANLLAAIMLAESGGRVGAVSSADALGLYQLQLGTARDAARWLDLPEPTRSDLLTDRLLNARLGARYLRWLSERYEGDLERMLIAYNAGPGRLDGWIEAAGGYAAWRAERVAAGNSDVLAYVAKVERTKERFAERGVIVPRAPEQPPEPPAGEPTAVTDELRPQQP
jgi:soluble lytic murein transglycosylase-like protein